MSITWTCGEIVAQQTVSPKAAQSDVTELNWHGLVVDKLTNGQAVMYYSRHRLTASMSMWLRTHTCQPLTNGFILVAHWSVHQKLNRVSSIQFSYIALLKSC